MAKHKRLKIHGEGASESGGKVPPQVARKLRGEIPQEYCIGGIMVNDKNEVTYLEGGRVLSLLGLGEPLAGLTFDSSTLSVVEPVDYQGVKTGFYIKDGEVKSLYRSKHTRIPVGNFTVETEHIHFYDLEAYAGKPIASELSERLARINQELKSGGHAGFTNTDEVLRRLHDKDTN